MLSNIRRRVALILLFELLTAGLLTLLRESWQLLLLLAKDRPLQFQRFDHLLHLAAALGPGPMLGQLMLEVEDEVALPAVEADPLAPGGVGDQVRLPREAVTA